jgi:hypothetical protein
VPEVKSPCQHECRFVNANGRHCRALALTYHCHNHPLAKFEQRDNGKASLQSMESYAVRRWAEELSKKGPDLSTAEQVGEEETRGGGLGIAEATVAPTRTLRSETEEAERRRADMLRGTQEARLVAIRALTVALNEEQARLDAARAELSTEEGQLVAALAETSKGRGGGSTF